jgi:aminopeptidase N
MRVLILCACALLVPATGSAQRLPSNVTPVHYDITVAPDLAAATFSGEETIRVRLAAPASSITLNAAEIRMDDVSISAGGRTQKASVKLDAAQEQATLSVLSALPAGEAEIHIAYQGILNNDLRGLYLSNANNRRYAVTQLEATDARRMFPCFDEPAFKATFALTAIIDSGDHAISNGAVISDTPGPGSGKHTVKFETTPKMSSYLVALVVGDFECNEGTADAIPIRICSTPDKKAFTGFALEAARQLLQFYNRYYSVKYPFKKLDVVAVPDFAAGAMENTAAIFYRETLLLADETASVETRRAIAEVLAHEMAHQWFGDLVTMQWWDDIWLNEGFANWMQTKPVAAWKPDWQMELSEVRANQAAMRLDALRSTRAIRAKASTPAEIFELFDAIAYEKGAAVLRMIEAWVGEEAFRAGVNAYIERFKYGNARAEDFWTTLAAATGKPVDRVMPTFVDRPGVPVIGVEMTCAGDRGTVVVTQERYAEAGAPAGDSGNGVWQVPVCLRTSSGKTVCELVTQRRATVGLDACPAWVVANAGARGYYRSALPTAMIGKIAADLSKLPPTERLQILADEWALVRAGRHGVDSYLDLASGFGSEQIDRVLATLGEALATIGDYLTTDETRAPFRGWVRQLFAPAAKAAGGSGSPGDDDNTRALRATVLRVLGGVGRDPDVLAKARALIEQELATPESIEPTLLDVVVTLAAIEGDAALYEKYLAQSKAANEPEDARRYLYGLAAFSDPALVRRTLDYALGSDMRSQDAPLVIGSLLRNPAARRLVWDLLRARWDEVQKKVGAFNGTTAIVGSLASFCDVTAAEGVRRFFSEHKVPGAERTLAQSLERISSCARLSQSQADKLGGWLRSRGKDQRPETRDQRPKPSPLLTRHPLM